MKRLLAQILLVSAISHVRAEDHLLRSTPAQVYFSPNGGCTDALVAAIRAARTSILVQAYSFTSAPVARALVEAHRRGARVNVILDRSQRSERYSGLTFLQHAGVHVVVDSSHAIAHNKVMVIDGETVVTGSFNFTKAAEHSNAENLLIIRDAGLARAYVRNWEYHRAHSD